MKKSRRDFIKTGILTIAGAAIPLSAFEFLSSEAVADVIKKTNKRWAFVVDTTKCIGCGMCVKACKLENEVPYNDNLSRTWVERYILTKDGRLIVDSPKQGRDGYIKNNPLGKQVSNENISKAFFVPKLCNQCDKPLCVEVCPVGATYKTPDGVVLVDRKWCVGCAVCITNCPYGARFFHPTLHVIDKCNFCYHRITKGMNSACVDACAFGARKIGDIKNPHDLVAKIIMTERVAVLKPEYHSEPQVYYIGLSKEVK